MVRRPTRHLVTVKEYERMARAGVFDEDDRVELLDGEILDLGPIGSAHAATVARIAAVLHERLGRTAVVRVQDPIRLGDLSEPQPDIAVVSARKDFYVGGHPGPEDVLLLIEVADTSADFDRDRKVPAYARWKIPEVLLVDLPNRRIEVFRSPAPEGYADKSFLPAEDPFSSSRLSNLRLSFHDFFGALEL